MKRVISCLIIVVLALSMSACGKRGDKNDDGRGDATAIVIYNGGSSEYSVVRGTDEETAITAIEEKYYTDTGINLDFQIHYLGSSMKSKLAATIGGSDPLDIVVSHTRGGAGIDEYALANNLFYDISDFLEDYGANILDNLSDEALSSVTTYDKKIVGIPSVINPNKYGILVRKDYMDACGYTYDIEDTDKTYVGDLETFTQMCLDMKVHIKSLLGENTYVISGAVWDVEKVLIGAFADAGYWSYAEQYDGEGRYLGVVPGFATKEYGGLIDLEYDWVTNGIISTSANNISLELFESEFIAGKTGVFVCDPTVQHLISVSRKTAAYNEDAEFVVMGALPKDADSTRKGFMRNSEATFAAVIMKNSPNARDIIKFYNWMYSSAENYELCTYGIEGTHWVRNADGTYGYPNAEYLTKKPYSGAVALVENQLISTLTYSGYTEQERAWIALAADDVNYVTNNTVNYLLPYNASLNDTLKSAINPFYSDFATQVWFGELDPYSVYSTETGKLYFEHYREQFLTVAESYLDTVSDYYAMMNPSVHAK